MFLGLGVSLIIFLGVILIGGAVLIYRKCPNDVILVKYGLGGNKIITSNGTFILPIVQGCKKLNLKPMNIDIDLREDSNVVSNDKIRVVVEADATFAISSSPEERIIASHRLLSFNDNEICALAKEILTGQTRTIISEMEFEDLLQDRVLLMTKVSENAEKELSKLGLDLINYNIKMIKDMDGITEMLGKKASALATSDAQIAVAEQQRKSDVGVAEANAQRDIAVTEQDKIRQIQVSKTKAVITEETIKAELIQTNATQNKMAEEKRMESESQKAQNLYRIETEKSINLKELDKEKEIKLQEESLKQEIADKSKETVKKQAEVALETQRAKEIVETKVYNEKLEIEKITELKLKKLEADNQLEIAKIKADAIKVALPIEKKAEAEKKLLEVYGQSGIMGLKLIEILPQLAKAQADAVANIDINSLNIIAGDGGSGSTDGSNGAGNQIAGIVTDITRAIPAFKMANDIAKSINMPELSITGDNSKKEK
ncbi:flotillin family protein [Fusobacterium ulcerans]|uniref:flotillin family protein n=1 Tax=Fusobacterium ulcerans TaxID=861 RepID=UPI0026DDA43D|nr:flotillin family protein [Fusobacterium ulcerans]